MGCKQLQLPDYFRLTKSEYSPTKYREARFTQSMTGVSPRQNDSLKGLSYSRINYDYHISGQIASASIYSKDERPFVSTYDWDGLALIRKSTGTNALRRTEFTNEPAVTGGNPILATNNNGTNLLFNDMLGTTLGVIGSKDERPFVSTAITAFGETTSKDTFFTGKPNVEGLGYAFLFRNVIAGL